MLAAGLYLVRIAFGEDYESDTRQALLVSVGWRRTVWPVPALVAASVLAATGSSRGTGGARGGCNPPDFSQGIHGPPRKLFGGIYFPEHTFGVMIDSIKHEAWKSIGNCVYETSHHIVWSTRCRRKVLTPPVDVAARDLLQEICAQHGYEVKGLEVMPDHIHLFISVPPARAVATAVKLIKGASAPDALRAPSGQEAAMGRAPMEPLVLRRHSGACQQRNDPAVYRAPKRGGGGTVAPRR